jgi:hypothetical protein
MSDAFGATDLDADMPGLGPQTGNVRGPPVQLPSQLHALVQHFTGAQGKPSPQSKPPAPGAGGGAQKKPQLGPVDPPDRGAYAIAPVPANAPRPPPKFNPYIPSLPRDSSQWGQPEAFPRLPQSFELPGIYKQLGGYFAQSGGFRGAPLGAGMAAYSAAYQEAFQKGQEQKMRMSMEQMKLHAAQLEDVEQTRAVEYADTFNRYQVEGDKDPQGLHDALWKTAVEHGDKDVMAMLENGDSAEEVRRFLSKHEANIRDLSKANKKSDEVDAQDAQYGLAPARREDEDAYGPDTTRPPGVIDKGKDAPADETRDENQKLIDKGAWDMVEGYKPTGSEYGKMTQTMMAKRKLEMEQALQEIAADPNINKDGQHPEEVLDAVRKRVPEAASTLDQYSKYEEGPGVGGRASTGGPEAQMWGLMNPLAAKMHPGDPKTGIGAFNPDNLQAIHQFRDPNGQTQKQVQRIGPTVEAATQLITALNKLPPEQRQNLNLEAIKAKMVGGDPLYRAIWANWLNYNQDVNALSVPGGSVTETVLSENQVPWYSSSAEYLSVIREHIGVAASRVDEFHNSWKQYGSPAPMPGLNKAAEEQIPRIRRLDVATGMLPGDRRTAKDGKTYEYTGKDMDDRNADANWKVVKNASP